MSKPDELLVDVAALVESGQSNQMSLTVVTGGAVITGRLAPEAVWCRRRLKSGSSKISVKPIMGLPGP
ncbi:hypothetical protein [Streptomyces mirabilis]|jgi:hypothetical protein|uniref:hypothetical protein n=1 Tax=Streptomyces mirabilis TaxID=68239 RepID=UPI0036BEBBFB